MFGSFRRGELRDHEGSRLASSPRGERRRDRRPENREPTDAIIKVTASAICGSDLHLYDHDAALLVKPGDIFGHEPVGEVVAMGSAVTHIAPGDRVVVPFNISCGSCFMCSRQLYSQCETTAGLGGKKGASLFGYTHMYGGVAGGQAEYLRVPQGPFRADSGAGRRAGTRFVVALRRVADGLAGGGLRRHALQTSSCDAGGLVTTEAPLAEAAEMYEAFKSMEPGVIKVVLRP